MRGTLARSVIRFSGSVQNRRRWEQRIAAVLRESREDEISAAATRFDRIYRNRNYTAVEDAFPLRDHARWADVSEGQHTATASSGDVVGQPPDPHVLHATFLGPQNVGKTSLVNALALSHVGAVSSRAGSTRDWTKAVATVHNTQLLLLDTPGIVPVRGEKDRRRHASAAVRAWDSLYVADLVVLVLPAGLGFVEQEHKLVAREVIKRAAARQLPVVWAITMMDKVQTARHRELYFAMRTDFEAIGLPIAITHEVSVKGGSGLVEMKDLLARYAVPGAWEHARRETTDLALVDRVAEMLRQVYLELLPHEIPHKLRHRVIGWTRKDSGTTEVVVEVFFDRPAYLFTFYAKLEAVCLRAQLLTERELHSRYRFVFQAFIAPGGVASQ